MPGTLNAAIGGIGGATVTVTSSLAVKTASLAGSRSTYVPGSLHVACVGAALAFPKVTIQGPFPLLHEIARVAPAGRPSSVAVPFSVAAAGRVTLRSGPALTMGGWFTTTTVTVAFDVVTYCVSLALSCRT